MVHLLTKLQKQFYKKTARPTTCVFAIFLLLYGIPLLVAAQAPALPRATRQPVPIGGHRLTISVGALHNRYDDRATIGYSPEPTVYSHRSSAGGVEASYQWAPDSVERPFNTVGGGVWAGSETIGIYKGTAENISRISTASLGNHGLYTLHLYTEGHKVTSRHKLDFDYRLGLYAGSLAHFVDDRGLDMTTTYLLPDFMLAIGKHRVLFGQLDAGHGAENALGNYTARFALGSGLGRQHGSTILMGYALGPNHPAGSMGFISTNLRLPIGSGLSALKLEPYFATNFSRHNVFSLKLHYELSR